MRSSLLVLALIASGCGGPPDLDKSLAAQALEQGLRAWKEGLSPAALRTGDPPIVFGDHDWEQGASLLNYQVLDSDHDDGSNLHAEVRLTLENRQKKRADIVVTYIVGTQPQITVFRK